MRVTLIVSLIIAILAVIFALQNPGLTTVKLGPFESEHSTALVLIVTFALGALVGILVMTPRILKDRKQVRALKKQVNQEPAASSASDPPASTPASSSESDSAAA